MSGWEPRQAKEFAKQTRKEIGDGWKYMTHDVRVAFAHQKALTVARMQVRPVNPKDMDALVAMIEQALELR